MVANNVYKYNVVTQDVARASQSNVDMGMEIPMKEMVIRSLSEVK